MVSCWSPAISHHITNHETFSIFFSVFGFGFGRGSVLFSQRLSSPLCLRCTDTVAPRRHFPDLIIETIYTKWSECRLLFVTPTSKGWGEKIGCNKNLVPIPHQNKLFVHDQALGHELYRLRRKKRRWRRSKDLKILDGNFFEFFRTFLHSRKCFRGRTGGHRETCSKIAGFFAVATQKIHNRCPIFCSSI